MTFGATDLSNTTVGTNQIPVSAVYVPGTAGSNLTAVEGIAVNTDSNSQKSSAMRVGLKDGDDVTLGLTTQTKATDGSTTSWSVIQLLKGIFDKLLNTLAVTQSGTWTVQPGNTANTTAWKVDGSAVTQPVSGTVTANAGTNLNTSALALDTSVNGVIVAQGSTTSGEKGPLTQGAVTTSAPSYTTAQTSPLSLNTAGGLRVDGSGVTQPVSGTVTANQGGAPWSENITQFGGTNISTGTGAGGAGIPRVTVSNDSSLAANQSVNVNQVGGTNIVTGGVAGLIAVGGPVASAGANADNPIKIGGVFNTTQPTVTNGQVVDAQTTARGAQIVATGVDTFNATINAALPTGANTIGAVTQASGPWTSNITQFGGTNVATGTGAGGAGIPRVTVSNDSQVQLWDGTNRVNVMAATSVSNAVSAQASQLTAGGFAENASLSAGSLNADLVPSTDVSNYKCFTLQINGVWSGTLSFQCSNDNATWFAIGVYSFNSYAQNSTTTANGLFTCQTAYRYLRVRMTSYTSGTATGVLELYTYVSNPLTLGAVQNGTWTVQPGNTQNTTPWLVSMGPPADLTLIASAAFTTTQTTADQANFAGKGIRVVLDVTNAGTGSVTLEIDVKDVASGKYVALLTGAAVTTVSTNVYVIHPELTAAANSIAKDVLPHTWRVKVTANNANSVTYSVGASYLT